MSAINLTKLPEFLIWRIDDFLPTIDHRIRFLLVNKTLQEILLKRTITSPKIRAPIPIKIDYLLYATFRDKVKSPSTPVLFIPRPFSQPLPKRKPRNTTQRSVSNPLLSNTQPLSLRHITQRIVPTKVRLPSRNYCNVKKYYVATRLILPPSELSIEIASYLRMREISHYGQTCKKIACDLMRMKYVQNIQMIFYVKIALVNPRLGLSIHAWNSNITLKLPGDAHIKIATFLSANEMASYGKTCKKIACHLMGMEYDKNVLFSAIDALMDPRFGQVAEELEEDYQSEEEVGLV